MSAIRSADLTAVESPGRSATTPIATPPAGAIGVSVMRQCQQPGGENTPHSHDREEVIIMLGGWVEIAIDGERHQLGPGDAVILPPDALRQLRNQGGEPADWLLIAPSGIRFFHADSSPVASGWAE
ncbi:MAG TPA: cupin domain-containing protein [Thermomicrobiales bacterium]|nr:cupin domain-containing protein [Thermomicrobiales bacterium]